VQEVDVFFRLHKQVAKIELRALGALSGWAIWHHSTLSSVS